MRGAMYVVRRSVLGDMGRAAWHGGSGSKWCRTVVSYRHGNRLTECARVSECSCVHELDHYEQSART